MIEYAGWMPLVCFLVGLVAGFVIGFLVYRNNPGIEKKYQRMYEEKFAEAQAELARIKEKLGVK
jgi:uncharacterized membrane-anchored protein YhcB (DUF1043 family)